MAKAVMNGEVIAESDDYEELEGNVYFPLSSVKDGVELKKSDTPYNCPWKGDCQYHDVVIDGKTEKDAAWEYPEPKEAAKNIKGHIAFDKDKVEVEV